MSKKVVRIVIIIAVAAVVIQLVPYGRAHANPPVTATPAWDSTQTEAYFSRACADCHSNETKWPWYSNIAPASWLVQNHVDEGRARFNASEPQGNSDGAEEAAEIVRKGEMPLPDYLLLHPEARLSATEREQFIQGLTTTFGGEAGED